MSLLVVLGGARSGKSALAQRLASAGDAVVSFIATAEALDDEMRERIAHHRTSRPADWITIEEPLDVVGALAEVPGGSFVVLDCLTLWVSNMIEAGWSSDRIADEGERAARACAERIGSSVVVSNEVGMGVVPATELGRRFRDDHGRINAAFCGLADHVALVVAGRLLELASPDAFVEAFRRG